MSNSIRYGGAVDRVAASSEFGFVRTPAGDSIFIHKSAMLDGHPLKAGTQITYIVIETTKGLRAGDVEVIGGAADRVQTEPGDPPPDRSPGSSWR